MFTAQSATEAMRVLAGQEMQGDTGTDLANSIMVVLPGLPVAFISCAYEIPPDLKCGDYLSVKLKARQPSLPGPRESSLDHPVQ